LEARNRILDDWYGKIKRGEIKLPRFQRYEAWDRHRICSLISTVINNLPLGITLVLEVGDEEKFISRNLKTVPDTDSRTQEHLLDGQQRLTAIWRVLHNNYDWETYFVYVAEFDNYEHDIERDDMTVFYRSRYVKKNGVRYPLWCNDPTECLKRGFIPTDLLKPGDIQDDIDKWLDTATKKLKPENMDELEEFFNNKKKVSDKIKDLRSIIANYNLPYLSLPSNTDKSVALDVFINMNTNSKPLSTYDIIVAEVESVMGQSLHDLQDALDEKYPNVGKFSVLSDMILNTSSLLQNKLPNQSGAWEMNKQTMVDNWAVMENGLNRMADFLMSQRIFDRQRLPTNAVLAVIAALYSNIPETGDKRGQDELLLKKYLWHSFFSDRYENAAASRAYMDYSTLKSIICDKQKRSGQKYTTGDVPIFAEHKLVEAEELLTAEWPKRATIRGRAILAVTSQLGAFDFSTGERMEQDNLEKRHYHHLYPDALLKEAEINSFLALNCALITDKTNMAIGRKDPVDYMRDRYTWVDESIVSQRLQSHMIPIQELANGGYPDTLTEEKKNSKLEGDFEKFLMKRADMIISAVNLLIEGKQISLADIHPD